MIDEKKLIKDIKDWQEDIHDNEYDANKFDFIFERIYEIFDEQPKISLENKTSDNMNSSCSGQVWIPCKGCYNCGHKECEHYGKS